MRYLLDTNVCVRYLNDPNSVVTRRVRVTPPEDIVLCSIVKAELFYGAMKSNNPQRTLAVQQQFLSQFISLPFDDHAAELYGRIRATLATQGTPIGPNDLMIAAIALANDATLVTRNVREFERVGGLTLENWEV